MDLLRGLTAPAKPREKSFDELIDLLQNHLFPKPLEIADFIASLKQMTEHCNFEAFLPQALRDRFVCGLSNPHIQKKLLCEHSLTLQKAVTIASAMEQATQDAIEIQKQPDIVESTVNNMMFTR